MKKAAVILCGSGFKDGSEIREAVGVLWALSEEGIEATCFALDAPQFHVVDCLSGEVAAGETRNQRVEAARIARGEVRALPDLSAADFDYLVIPGGFGAAKNLCSFALEGAAGKVDPTVQKVLEDFRARQKPIGAVCIAPAIVALAFPGAQIELTLGAEGDAARAVASLGHRHVAKGAAEWQVDRRHKIVTTPAYMHDEAPLRDIFRGIRGLVRELQALG